MLDSEHFVAQCDAAILAGGGVAEVYELLAPLVANPATIVAALGEPIRTGLQVLHRSPRLTVINLTWPSMFISRPHNHLMWAVIGVYGGREDNMFWRRCPPDARRPIEAIGARSLITGDACELQADIIHSVTNPLGKLTAGIHIYGGDIFAPGKSQWNGEALMEEPRQLLPPGDCVPRLAEQYPVLALPDDMPLRSDGYAITAENTAARCVNT